ncbi:hypothetical protein HYS54_00080 [Candidatus Micrarchaeota archaeon]|nr:hypothetical protein [Candidatus Micrarchaeota archaeon]
MAVDEGILSIVKGELRAGKDAESMVEKLRDLGYSDAEVERIMQSAIPGKVFVIKRPARPTVFKTVVAPRSMALILVLVLVVGGLTFGVYSMLAQPTLSDIAKRLAERTPEGQLFVKGTELHNRVIACMPAAFSTIPADRKEEFRAAFSKLATCSIQASTRIEKVNTTMFNVTFRVEENECGFHYLPFTDLLTVVVDVESKSADPRWLAPATFNETVVDAFYEQRGCDTLIPLAKQLAGKLLRKPVP